jgi:hypothetical protein
VSRKRSRMGEVLGTDHAVIARFVDIWRKPRKVVNGQAGPVVLDDPAGEPCQPIFVNDIAWELGLGAGKVAITFKYAEEQGWVRRTNARTEQAAYEPTEKALEQYPESGPQVMPAQPQAMIGKTVVRGATQEELRDDEGWTEVTQLRPGSKRVSAPKPPELEPPDAA